MTDMVTFLLGLTGFGMFLVVIVNAAYEQLMDDDEPDDQ